MVDWSEFGLHSTSDAFNKIYSYPKGNVKKLKQNLYLKMKICSFILVFKYSSLGWKCQCIAVDHVHFYDQKRRRHLVDRESLVVIVYWLHNIRLRQWPEWYYQSFFVASTLATDITVELQYISDSHSVNLNYFRKPKSAVVFHS